VYFLQSQDLELPADWRQSLAGYHWETQTVGCSEAAVFRLEALGRPALFVKTEPAGRFAELPGEIDRLRWLSATGIPGPRVLSVSNGAGRDWLLMTAVPGVDLASSSLTPKQAVEIAADTLRGLHRLDPVDCPFDQRLDGK
ncbi:phosphotransferase, partial [Rhizobiaceae sp. 2RAB30]